MNDLIVALRKKRMEGDNGNTRNPGDHMSTPGKPEGIEAKIAMLDEKLDRILACVESYPQGDKSVDNLKEKSNAY